MGVLCLFHVLLYSALRPFLLAALLCLSYLCLVTVIVLFFSLAVPWVVCSVFPACPYSLTSSTTIELYNIACEMRELSFLLT